MASIKHNSKIKISYRLFEASCVWQDNGSGIETGYCPENHDYYTPIVPDDSYLYHVYDTLDVVYMKTA